MENAILRMMYLHFEVWSDMYVQKKRQKNTETDINSIWRKAIWLWSGDRHLRWYIIETQDSDKMSEAIRELKKQRYNLSRKPWQRPQRPPTGIVRLSLVSMDRPDRPDLPSHLKYCSGARDDHMETLPGRSQTTRTTETTSIAWIELSSIRTDRNDGVNFEMIIWKRSQTTETIGTIEGYTRNHHYYSSNPNSAWTPLKLKK